MTAEEQASYDEIMKRGRTRPSSASSPSSTVFSSRCHVFFWCADTTAVASAKSKITLMLF